MRNYLIMIVMAISMTSCSSWHRNRPVSYGPNMLIEAGDREEYEITIIDPGFDSWFATNARPVDYYSLLYYEQHNARYVTIWNERASQQGLYRSPNYPFENRIDYDVSKSYGLEVNYKLFWYFRYIESQFGNRYNFHL